MTSIHEGTELCADINILNLTIKYNGGISIDYRTTHRTFAVKKDEGFGFTQLVQHLV